MPIPSPKNAKPVDLIVGGNIRSERARLKLSQGALGEKLNITFQQVQKYEKGINRVSASRLVEMCIVFDTPIERLFAGTELDKIKEPNIPPVAYVLAHIFDDIPEAQKLQAISALRAVADSFR